MINSSIFKRLYKLLLRLVSLILIVYSQSVSAAKPVSGTVLACSASDLGNAVINEINTSDNFIEIYLLSTADIFDWTLYEDYSSLIAILGKGICQINGTSQPDNTSSGTTSTTWPAGTFITCDFALNPSFDEILLADRSSQLSDNDTAVIDYLGYGKLPSSVEWIVDSACSTLYPGHKSTNKDIARIPDGTGTVQDNGNNSTKGTTNDPTTGIDHYEIYHDGAGLTCLDEPITVKACTNSDCSALATDDISATLSIGASDQLVTISSGGLNYDFSYTTAGTFAVSISNMSEPAPVNCFINNVLDANCNITFSDSSFVITVPTLTACKPAIATIKAVATDPTTNTCKAALSGNRDIYFWNNYENPNSGSISPTLKGTTITTSPPGTAVNLQFSANGEASFDINYADAGQLSLSARYTVTNGKTLTGTSLPFVSTPVALAVYSDDINADCESIDANCSQFKKAGEPFNLTVNAACWTHDGDTDFTDNPVTPNFALLSIANNHTLLAPAGGVSGSLGLANLNFSTSDNGSHIINQSISEVGVFNFGVSPPSYFGEILTTATSDAIGRFYPDHFKATTLTDGAFGANACTGFSYSGQSFFYQTAPQLTLTAYNAASPEAITQNYTADFVKLLATDFIVTPPTSDANQIGADLTNLVRLLWSPDVATLTDNSDGTLTFSFGNDGYSYLHETNSRIAPFINAVDLIFTAISDSDGVATTALPHTLQPTGEAIRFGRMAITNSHGSELAPLPVTIQTEFFNGISWQPNVADQCTVLNLTSHFQLQNPQTAAGSWQLGNSPMQIDLGSTSGALTNNNPLSNGTALLTFSAPGEDNQGYVNIQSQLFGSYNWLLGDYDNDGAYDDEASGRASFGLFKGSDKIIFRRELY